MASANEAAVTAAADLERKPALAWVLASLALCMLLPSLAISSANVALPTLGDALGASFQHVQWVVLAYLLASTTLIVSVGRLGDAIGRRRLLVAGVVLFTLASAACGLASGLWPLVAARAAQGLGAAILMALGMAFVGEVVPKAKAGSAMGLLGSMSAIGTALGPTLGGLLIAGFGWQAIFFVNVPLGLVAVVLVLRHLPRDHRAPTTDLARFDLPGTLLLALTLAAYALAMTLGRGSFGMLNVALLLAAVLGLGLFVWVETVVASPLIRLAQFRDVTLSAGLVTSTLVSTVVMATLVVGPFYLARGHGLQTAWVGAVMSVGPVVAALVGVPAGRLVDRFGAEHMAAGGLVGMATGCLALCLTPLSLGVAGYVLPLAVITAGYALFQAANNTAVMADVPAPQRGVVSGLLNLSRNLGLITGAAMMGAVFAVAAGTVDLTAAQPAAVVTGMQVTFAVAALFVGAALTAALGRRVLLGRTARSAP